MATRTVTALFDRYQDAADAVRQLEAAGIAHADISILSNDESHAQFHGGVPGADSPGAEHHISATGTGASLGTLLGGGAGQGSVGWSKSGDGVIIHASALE